MGSFILFAHTSFLCKGTSRLVVLGGTHSWENEFVYDQSVNLPRSLLQMPW